MHKGIRWKKCAASAEINLAVCCVSFVGTSSKSKTDVSFRREFHLGRRGKEGRAGSRRFFPFFWRGEGDGRRGREEQLVSIIHHRAQLFRDDIAQPFAGLFLYQYTGAIRGTSTRKDI